jgi:SPW repeat
MKQVKLRHIGLVKPKRSFTLRQPDIKESEGGPYSAADLHQIHIASGTNIVAGTWLMIAPVFFCPQAVIRWNDAIVGLLLIVLAALRYVHPLHRFWMSWLNASLGLWLTASPFLLGCQHIAPQVNDTTLGFIVFVAGAVSASVRSGDR